MYDKEKDLQPFADAEDPFFEIANVTSTTECTGLVPAGIEDNAEADSYGELYAIHPPKAEEKNAKK